MKVNRPGVLDTVYREPKMKMPLNFCWVSELNPHGDIGIRCQLGATLNNGNYFMEGACIEIRCFKDEDVIPG